MDYCNEINWLAVMAMAGDYDKRKVNNTERDTFTLDTVKVYDRDWLYETAVKHNEFNRGAWIILEGCDTKEEAIAMHNKWLEILDKDDYFILTDCYEDINYEREVE